MSRSWEFPPLPPDRDAGPSNHVDGTNAAPTLPKFMDKEGTHGQLVVLKMEAESGKLPEHPFLLRTSVEKFINGKIDGAFPEAHGLTYALKVRSQRQMEQLLGMSQLLDGTKIKITKHTGLNSVRCVINCREIQKVSDEDVLKYLAEQKVSYVRRITRRNGENIENTSTVILTIDGTAIPEHVDVGYLRCKTRPFYPAPMLCYKCFTFGHTKARCQQQVDTCGHCSKQHVVIQGVRCTDNMFCSRCKKDDHSISSRKCPTYIFEDAIQHIRVDKGITYPAARRLFEASVGKNSFANVTSASKDKVIADLSAKVELLVKSSADKDLKIAALEDRVRIGQPTSNCTDFQEFRDAIVELKNELRKKDAQILELQNTLAKKSDRLEQVRTHGTIEDLVAKNKALQDAVASKDKEISSLRDSISSKKTVTATTPMPLKRTSKQQQQPTQEQQNNNQPKSQQSQNTGTKKKTVAKKNSNELTTKRVKASQSPMTISDAEDSPDPNISSAPMEISDSQDFSNPNNPLALSQVIISDFAISSDEDLADAPDPLSEL